MIKLTQRCSAPGPDLQRHALSPEQAVEVVTDFYHYFTELTTDRQAHPTDDLAAHRQRHHRRRADTGPGEMGCYVIIATAGHDTTAAAMAGGLRALAEHPDQLQLMQGDPDICCPTRSTR